MQFNVALYFFLEIILCHSVYFNIRYASLLVQLSFLGFVCRTPQSNFPKKPVGKPSARKDLNAPFLLALLDSRTNIRAS